MQGPRKRILPADTVRELPSTGPSDSSDYGSDLIGTGLEAASDRQGTGERASAEQPGAEPLESDLRPDRIVTAGEAGLGGGLDQAEEAQLGVTDEEIQEAEDRRLGRD